MMRNKIAAIIPAAMLALSLAACGTTASNAPAETPAAETTAVEAETPAEETAAGEGETSETSAAADTAAEAAAAEETAAAAAEEDIKYTNGGVTLSVPANYNELMIVNVPENDENGVLFELYEKASVEAARAQDENVEGAGWLFSIKTADEQYVQDALCTDMSGQDVFAKTEKGIYYLNEHPTDVRFVREQYNDVDEDMEQWNELHEWAATVPGTFVAENDGLTRTKHTYTDLDQYFARIAYKNDVNYTLASLEHGVVEPGDIDPEPYIGTLVNGVTFEYADETVEAPDGEYVVFAIPEDNVRYDFFFAENGQNLVREVKEMGGEEYEILYEATVSGDASTVNEIMNGWYEYLIENGGNVIENAH